MVCAGINLDTKENGFASIDTQTKKVIRFIPNNDKDKNILKAITETDTNWHKLPLEIRKNMTEDFCHFKKAVIG